MPLQEELETQGNWLFRYRGILPFILFAAGAAMFIRTKLDPQLFFLENTRHEETYAVLCLCVSLAGLIIRCYTVGHSAKNTSGRNTKEGQLADSLNTTGIYSTLRHPLYLGNFFMWLGPALMPGQLWFAVAFSLVYWLYYERIMFAEEQFLRKKFGEVYLAWASTVPAFIPSFKNFRKPALSFSWKKVLQQEKTGLLLTFLIFAVFDIAGKRIQQSDDYNMIFVGGAVFSILFYVAMKLVKPIVSEKDR